MPRRTNCTFSCSEMCWWDYVPDRKSSVIGRASLVCWSCLWDRWKGSPTRLCHVKDLLVNVLRIFRGRSTSLGLQYCIWEWVGDGSAITRGYAVCIVYSYQHSCALTQWFPLVQKPMELWITTLLAPNPSKMSIGSGMFQNLNMLNIRTRRIRVWQVWGNRYLNYGRWIPQYFRINWFRLIKNVGANFRFTYFPTGLQQEGP